MGGDLSTIINVKKKMDKAISNQEVQYHRFDLLEAKVTIDDQNKTTNDKW